MTNKTVKQESSVPVQSRISLISLAELAKYWERTEYNIKSMSQLVSWSLDLLRDILKANEMIDVGDEFERVVEARDYLVERRLWQSKVAGRAFVKLGSAIRFQGFRDEGINPETRDEMSKVGHNLMHNKHSVSPYRDKVSARQMLVDEATRKYHEMFPEEGEAKVEVEEPEKLCQEEVRTKYRKEQAELKRLKEETIEEVKNSNVISTIKEGMSDEELKKDREEKDAERIKLENAPFSASDLPIVGK